MHIFIDEAGLFLLTDPTQHNVSMVGALIIPDDAYEPICKLLNILKMQWDIVGEVKGKDLKEPEVNLLIQHLEKYDILFIPIVIDVKYCDKTITYQHRSDLMQAILSSISPHHHPNVVAQIKEFSKTVEQMPEQLYIQWYALRVLFIQIIQLSTFYYAQRQPKELGSFKWLIDAKDKNGITKNERWFIDTLQFFIQGISQHNPLKMLEDADYSYYKNFDIEDADGTDIKKLLEDLSFADSAKNNGLQLVDILTTCLRKAMNGKFKARGYDRMGRLMTRLDGDAVLSIALDPKIAAIRGASYYKIIQKLNVESKKIICS